MSAPPFIASEWPRNGRETVRIQLTEFNGRAVIDVRTWWTAQDGELRPGKSGITLAVKHVERLAAGLTTAAAKARELGLLEKGAASWSRAP